MMLMGTQGEKQIPQGPCLMGLHDKNKHANNKEEDHWMIMGGDDNNNIPSSSTSAASSLEEDSSISNGSSTSSSDLVDDASSTSSNSSSVSNGPLFELSELMSQLPIKRGLSKYFDGKSQSFTSLSSVKSLEDLAKKESPYKKKIKTCKSYGGGLDNHRSSYTLPKATISKKVSRGSFSSLSPFPGKNRSTAFLGSSRPPTIPHVQKHF